jgi:hypothetical protein
MANGYPAAGYKWSLAMLITMTSAYRFGLNIFLEIPESQHQSNIDKEEKRINFSDMVHSDNQNMFLSSN